MDTTTVRAAIDTLGRRVARRRFRTIEEKIQIVTESHETGTSVAEVARRHGVNANQVFAWRRQHEQGVLVGRGRRGAVKLLPVEVRSEGNEPGVETSAARRAVPASPGRIEITLADGVRIAISGWVSTEQLHHVLSVLR